MPDISFFWTMFSISILSLLIVFSANHIGTSLVYIRYLALYKKKIIEYSEPTLKKMVIKEWAKITKRDCFYYWIYIGAFISFNLFIYLLLTIVITFAFVYPGVIKMWYHQMITYVVSTTIIYLIFNVGYITHCCLFIKKYKSINNFEIDQTKKEYDNITIEQDIDKIDFNKIYATKYFINRPIAYAQKSLKKFNELDNNKKSLNKSYWQMSFLLQRYYVFCTRIKDDQEIGGLVGLVFNNKKEAQNFELNYEQIKIKPKTVIDCFSKLIIDFYLNNIENKWIKK